jgi:hypothetical protein
MAIPPYEPVLSASAWEYFQSLSRKRQQRIARLIHQLAAAPQRLGDYRTMDQTGRPLENIRLERWLITYWEDGAARELRILDINEL